MCVRGVGWRRGLSGRGCVSVSECEWACVCVCVRERECESEVPFSSKTFEMMK